MKHLSKFILIIVVLGYQVYAQQIFKLDIKMPKTTYYIYENIEMGQSVINLTDKTEIYQVISGKANIINDKGEKIEINNSGFSWGPVKREFGPNYEDYRIIDIIGNYGHPAPGFIAGPWGINEGKYHLEIEFNHLNSQSEKIDLNFEVKYPEGEELLIYNQISDAITELKKSNFKDFNKYAESLKLIYNKYPNNVYSPIILNILISTYSINLKDEMTAEIISDELIEKCSWSGVCRGYLKYKLKNINSKTDRLEYLQKLLLSSKGSLMEKYYSNLIQKEKDND